MKMLNLITQLLIVIAILSNSVYGLECPKGQGPWAKTDGTVICRRCPTKSVLELDEALKVPLGCTATLSGALMTVSYYTDLKDRKHYATKLSEWQKKLQPTLTDIQENLKSTISTLEETQKYNLTLIKEIEDLKAKKETAERGFWISSISGVSVILILTTVLVID